MLSEIPKASIIVCTAGTRDFVAESVRALQRQSIEVEIIVVGPKPALDRFQKQSLTDLTRLILSNNQNLNEARNLGAKYATTDYMLYIDDDAIADFFWAENLSNSLVQSYDICGGRTLTSDSIHEEWNDATISPLGRGFSSKEFPTPESNGIANRTVAGNNFGIRRKSLEKLGGFDQIFRVFDDETDLCFRAASEGMKIGFEKKAVVHHYSIESDLRRTDLVPTAMFRPWVSRSFFAIRHGVIDSLGSLSLAIKAISQEIDLTFKYLDNLYFSELITEQNLNRLKAEILNGAECGLSLALQHISHNFGNKPHLSLFLNSSLPQGTVFEGNAK
jgi:GT2 family glycosyltransferase